MPKVHHRKARKDYPDQGIHKGDMYYTAKLRMQRGGVVRRSIKPLRPSQLTLSEYKSGFLATMENWDDNVKDHSAITSAAESLREIGEQCAENLENMPEGLKEGDTGQLLSTRSEECATKADELDSLAEEHEGLEEPVEPLGDLGDEGDDTAREEYDDAMSTYEAEQERIVDEAGELIGDMPE